MNDKQKQVFLVAEFILNANMGSCNSVICSEENREVETHKRRNIMRLKQAGATIPNVSASVEMIDIQSLEESLSEACSSSTLSGNESDVVLPRGELEALKIRGTQWPHSRHIDVRKTKPRKKKSFFNLKELQMKKDNKPGDLSKYQSKKLNRAPSAVVRHFSYSAPAPLPRPPPWKEVYLTIIKPKEQLAEENMKENARKNLEKRKHIVREDKIRALRKQLATTINPIKRKPSYIRRKNTPEDRKTEEDTSGVVDCDRDDSDERSFTSVSPASTTSSSAKSDSSSIISDDSFEFEESSFGCAHRGDNESVLKVARDKMLPNGMKGLEHGNKGKGKSRKMFGKKQNKVFPM